MCGKTLKNIFISNFVHILYFFRYRPYMYFYHPIIRKYIDNLFSVLENFLKT